MLGIVATLQQLIAIGVDVAPLVLKLAATFGKGATHATAADIEACKAMERQLRADNELPIPDELP